MDSLSGELYYFLETSLKYPIFHVCIPSLKNFSFYDKLKCFMCFFTILCFYFLSFFFFRFLRQGLGMYPRLTLNSGSSCLSRPCVGLEILPTYPSQATWTHLGLPRTSPIAHSKHPPAPPPLTGTMSCAHVVCLWKCKGSAAWESHGHSHQASIQPWDQEALLQHL
jgi:hypothetical protein